MKKESNCLDCFGGGLTKFTNDLLSEMKKKDIKIEDLVQEDKNDKKKI